MKAPAIKQLVWFRLKGGKVASGRVVSADMLGVLIRRDGMRATSSSKPAVISRPLEEIWETEAEAATVRRPLGWLK